MDTVKTRELTHLICIVQKQPSLAKSLPYKVEVDAAYPAAMLCK